MIRKYEFLGILVYLLAFLALLSPEFAVGVSLKKLFGIDGAGIKVEEAAGGDSEFGGAKEKQPDAESVVVPEALSVKVRSGGNIKLPALRKTLSVLDMQQRRQIMENIELFKNFVLQEAVNTSILMAAKTANIDQNENTLILTQRASDNIIRELYLNQLVASSIPADFPNEEQIRQYYEQNREKFVIEERVHIWQIFLPVDEGMTDKQIGLLRSSAQSIRNDLAQGKDNFSALAIEHSKHEISRLAGGYMGLIKLSELKPEIKAAIKKLKQDEISETIDTDEGIHILKKGVSVPEQSFRPALDQIKNLLLEQLRANNRQALIGQVNTQFPVYINEKNIEEWYLKLRTDEQLFN